MSNPLELIKDNDLLEVKQEPIEVKMYLYTDGSVGPTVPGYMGMGFHGYYYDANAETIKAKDLPPKGFTSKEGYIGPDNIHNYNNNPGHLVVQALGYLDGYYSDGKTIGIPNEAEMYAIEYGINAMLHKAKESNLKILEINVYSDSQIALIIYNRAYKHIKENPEWVKQDDTYIQEQVNNLYKSAAESTKKHICTIINYLKSILDLYPDIKYTFNKVPGHSGNIGNEQADMLAVTARKNSKQKEVSNISWTIGEKYWRPNIERHPFLRFKELFFIHNTDHNIKPDKAYFTIMNYKKGTKKKDGNTKVSIGKRTSDPIYGIVRMEETPSLIVDALTKYDFKFSNSPILVFAMDLNKLYHVDNYKFFNQFGTDALVSNGNKQLTIMSREPVIYPIHPPGLAKKVYDATNTFIDKLERARYEIENNSYVNGNGRYYVNITPLIYEGEGKKRKCILPSSGKEAIIVKDVKLDNGYQHTFTLISNVDIIDRNTLKALEKEEPMVYLYIEKEGPSVYGYYTIVISKTLKTTGIYQNLFSSKIYLENKTK